MHNVLLLPSVCLTKLLVIFKPPSTKLCSHEAWSLLTSCLTLSQSQSVSPSPYSHLSFLLVPLSLILSYLSPSCCLSLPFSPLSSSLFVPGSNEYLSRPCSVTWEKTHAHIDSHPLKPLSFSLEHSLRFLSLLLEIFRRVVVQEQANPSTHLILWIKEERKREGWRAKRNNVRQENKVLLNWTAMTTMKIRANLGFKKWNQVFWKLLQALMVSCSNTETIASLIQYVTLEREV